jgi:hypothetical protein
MLNFTFYHNKMLHEKKYVFLVSLTLASYKNINFAGYSLRYCAYFFFSVLDTLNDGLNNYDTIE